MAAQRRTWRIVAALIVLGSGCLAAWLLLRPKAGAGAPPPLPEPAVAQLPARAVAERASGFSAAEARAYALLGQLDDRRIPALPALDAETRAALTRARDLLDHQRRLPGGGMPTAAAGGAMAIIPGPAAGGGPQSPTPLGGQAAERRAGITAGERPAAAPGGAPTDAGPVARHLGAEAHPGGVALTAGGHVITGAGTWAALHYVPGRDPEPVISDHGQGGYAIALFPEDPGGVRLNGGLIVPGRFYQVTGALRVTGTAPVDVHIRPLSAVPTYSPTPCLPPSANG